MLTWHGYIICKFRGSTTFLCFDLVTESKPSKIQIFWQNLALKASSIAADVFYILFLLSK